MENVQLLVFNLLAAAIALLSYEAGWRWGANRKNNGAFQEEKASLDGTVGATLGLLAFPPLIGTPKANPG